MKQRSDTDRNDRRNGILDAALDCFLNYGFSKTSMQDIADRAGLSRPLLYLQFKNKVDLLKAIYDHLVDGKLESAKEELFRKDSSTQTQRLEKAMNLLILEPWKRISGHPKSLEFFESCSHHNQDSYERYESRQLQILKTFFKDQTTAEVFMFAANAILDDLPDPKTLEKRIRILVHKFTRAN